MRGHLAHPDPGRGRREKAQEAETEAEAKSCGCGAGFEAARVTPVPPVMATPREGRKMTRAGRAQTGGDGGRLETALGTVTYLLFPRVASPGTRGLATCPRGHSPAVTASPTPQHLPWEVPCLLGAGDRQGPRSK